MDQIEEADLVLRICGVLERRQRFSFGKIHTAKSAVDDLIQLLFDRENEIANYATSVPVERNTRTTRPDAAAGEGGEGRKG